MKRRGLHAYVTAICGMAVLSVVLQDWSRIDSGDWIGIGCLMLLGIFSEAVAIGINVSKSSSYSTITFIPFLASVLLFGPAAGVLVAVGTMVIGEFALRRKPLVKSAFNVAQWAVASAASGSVFVLLMPVSSAESLDFLTAMETGALAVPFAGLALTLFTTNYFAVAVAIALESQLPLRAVVARVVGTAGANLLYGILVSPLAIVVGLLYSYIHVGGLFLAILPLIFIRRSYHTNLQLKRANRSLLKALVKAIETRDPYTSGHSVRVSNLAGRIAHALGFPNRAIEKIKTAALLHDIGKIDAVYTGILGKQSDLSEREREMIESHVIKGVELLESVGSFDPSIVAAVRHHHEREDGQGYPDGLPSEAIPIGAKIIKVCDAIDAMLSDRPYRDALPLSTVREQLITYAGTQFDIRTVQVVVSSGILQEHQAEVEVSCDAPAMTVLAGALAPDDGPPYHFRDTLKTLMLSIRPQSTRDTSAMLQ